MPQSEHLSKHYAVDLDNLRTLVLKMGALVEGQVRVAIECFSGGQRKRLDEVIATEAEVNRLELELDEKCAHLIARRQPTARDLRLVLAVSKTVTDLERIGDEAAKIARMGNQLAAREGIQMPRVGDVTHSGHHALVLLRRALQAYAQIDATAAADIVREDETIDQEFRAILRQLITFMMEDPRTISTALDIIWIAKAIERIGDHAKNIAQYVVYIAEGIDVRHPGSQL
ncbi:MAG: phosphate signaling complex protein PhoU [Burkholderiales bacterium]